MFLYFKRREKRGKREAPWPRFLVLRRKTLTVGAALLAAAAIFGAVNAPAAVRASVATRQLPIYCVERDQKVCSISFDAAWGADNTQKILDVLADYGVKTTFFVAGNWADQYPEQAKAIVESGNELMNHSNAHDHYNSLTADQITVTLADKGKTSLGAGTLIDDSGKVTYYYEDPSQSSIGTGDARVNGVTFTLSTANEVSVTTGRASPLLRSPSA